VKTTFETVQIAYAQVYAKLCQETGETNPKSHTWYATTWDELRSIPELKPYRLRDRAIYGFCAIGDDRAPNIAWAFDRVTIYCITTGASRRDLLAFFLDAMGLTDPYAMTT
jgi:hypothetical protein